MQHYNLIPIGQKAVFYVPIAKLEKEYSNKRMDKTIHDFFIEHYNAYTVDNTHGFWRKGIEAPLIEDSCLRYEVSFNSEDVNKLIDFISDVCRIIEEECIYFTTNKGSFLIKPNGPIKS